MLFDSSPIPIKYDSRYERYVTGRVINDETTSSSVSFLRGLRANNEQGVLLLDILQLRSDTNLLYHSIMYCSATSMKNMPF